MSVDEAMAMGNVRREREMEVKRRLGSMQWCGEGQATERPRSKPPSAGVGVCPRGLHFLFIFFFGDMVCGWLLSFITRSLGSAYRRRALLSVVEAGAELGSPWDRAVRLRVNLSALAQRPPTSDQPTLEHPTSSSTPRRSPAHVQPTAPSRARR